MDTFRFRLNCIDNYQATPTDLDPPLRRGAGPSQKSREASPQVPVIRAFGATETGQKVCAHIHGALPYLYLEYNGSLEKDVGEFSAIQWLENSLSQRSQLVHRVTTSLHRSRPRLDIPPQCIRWEICLRWPHLVGQGSALLRVQCWLQSLPEGLHAQSYAHDSLRRSITPRSYIEPHFPTVRKPSTIPVAVDV